MIRHKINTSIKVGQRKGKLYVWNDIGVHLKPEFKGNIVVYFGKYKNQNLFYFYDFLTNKISLYGPSIFDILTEI